MRSIQFSVLPECEISKQTTLCTGETGIQAFLTLKVALTSFKCSTFTLILLSLKQPDYSAASPGGITSKRLFFFLSVWDHNDSSILRSHIWEHSMPCFKGFTCINSFNLCNKSLRWLHCCHHSTDCGTMRSPAIPLGHWISKWQSCDLIIQRLASEFKHLITCSTNPSIADTVTAAIVHVYSLCQVLVV